MEEAVQSASPAAQAGHCAHYARRRSEETVLYQRVQQQAESFFAQVEAETEVGLPEFIKAEFEAFLECGFWPMASCAFAAPSAPMKSSWPSPVKKRFLPLMRVTAHGRDRRSLGRSCHPPSDGAPMGIVVPHIIAVSAGRPSPSALADFRRCQLRLFDLFHQTGGFKSR